MAARYEPDCYNDLERLGEEFNQPGGWTLQDYTLSVALGVNGNHEATTLVAAELAEHHRELFAVVDFDSEYGCFFAHTPSEETARQLVDVIAAMVAERNPDARPGGMRDSPGFFGNFSTGE